MVPGTEYHVLDYYLTSGTWYRVPGTTYYHYLPVTTAHWRHSYYGSMKSFALFVFQHTIRPLPIGHQNNSTMNPSSKKANCLIYEQHVHLEPCLLRSYRHLETNRGEPLHFLYQRDSICNMYNRGKQPLKTTIKTTPNKSTKSVRMYFFKTKHNKTQHTIHPKHPKHSKHPRTSMLFHILPSIDPAHRVVLSNQTSKNHQHHFEFSFPMQYYH